MKKIFSCPIFELIEVTRNDRKFIRLFANDWVNILAFNKKNQLMLIKQYRHGIDGICIETPGGIIDNHEKLSPLVSAKRELLEETGYSSDDWTYLGSVHANPAYQNNQCHYYLAKNVKKVQEQDLDEGEEIYEVFFQPLTDVWKDIDNSIISHSIVIAGLGLYKNWKGKNG